MVAGDIPPKKVYEDDLVLAFLDINPVSLGHTLIIPKKHFQDVFEMDDQYLEAVGKASKKISSLLKEKLQCSAVNLLNASGKDAGQTVFHFHLHVVPRYPEDGLDLWFHGKKDSNLEEVFNKINS